MNWKRGFGLVVMSLCLALGSEEAQTAPAEGQKGAPMSGQAKGTFEVKVTPATLEEKDHVAGGRMTMTKTFQGDLEGTSRGEMWTADATVEGSGGYVAIEKVSGKLGERSGAFTLLHQGTMRRGGDFNMRLVVVPDSGIDGLTGLTGTMRIILEGGKHFYELDYTLPETRE